MDIFYKDKRSQIMGRVKSKNTKPELLVRSLLHKLGYRFRLHRRDLPGNPDIILPKYKKVIFVHGCFWHGHENCQRSKRPATNKEFWNLKLDKNIERDRKNISKLEQLGWGTLIVWTCDVKNINVLEMQLQSFLSYNNK